MRYALLALLSFPCMANAADIYYHPPADKQWSFHLHGVEGEVHVFIVPAPAAAKEDVKPLPPFVPAGRGISPVSAPVGVSNDAQILEAIRKLVRK